jgi:hypothetical protein
MKRHNSSEPPRLEPGEYSVLLAELATGIVLNLDGKRRLTGSVDDWILVFENLAEAEDFARQQVARTPEIECLVQGEQGRFSRRIFAEAAKPSPSQPESEQPFGSGPLPH